MHEDRIGLHRHRGMAPAEQVARHRSDLHQKLRELRASARRSCERGGERASKHLLVLGRSADRARSSEQTRRRAELERLSLALSAHDPDRTLARGYALVEDHSGEPVSSAPAARAAGEVRVRFRDGVVEAEVKPER